VNLGLAAATFAVVVPAELPDKTFVSCVVLGARYRPFPVWCGAAAGLVLQAGVGSAAGRLVALAPHRVVEGVVAALFLAGAAYMLLRHESSEEHEGEMLAEEEAREIGTAGEPSSLPIAATTFGVVALAELGDLTQVVVANLSARYRDALSVFVGSSVAFLLVAAVGVGAGRTIVRVVPLELVRRVSGVVLLGLGIASAVAAAGG